MIYDAAGNLFDADAEALVNTVNTVGVMGRGVALQMARAYPEILPPYEKACEEERLTPGTVLTVDLHSLHNPRYIINVPTKSHWNGKSRLDDIKSGLRALADELVKLGITSVAVPPLGCGLGGLDWGDVYPLIVSTLGNLPGVAVHVYGPNGAPDASAMASKTPRPRMTAGRASLIGLMRRYLEPQLDDETTLLEVHKLMYL